MERHIAAACAGRAPGISIREGLVAHQHGALCSAHALQAPAEGRLLPNSACKGGTLSQAKDVIDCQSDSRPSCPPSHMQGAEHIALAIPLPTCAPTLSKYILSPPAMLLQGSFYSRLD